MVPATTKSNHKIAEVGRDGGTKKYTTRIV